MANRERKNQMKFYASDEEKDLIDDKMKAAGISNFGAYARKMMNEIWQLQKSILSSLP